MLHATLIDDWGITSHTVDFYTPFFIPGEQPQNGDTSSRASADYRIGDITGLTVGLGFGQVNRRNAWSVALEYYLQSGDEPADKFGELQSLELYADVEAVMFRLLYYF